MKLNFFISILLTPIIFMGCLRTYYPAIYQSSSSPMVFETNNTTTESSYYHSFDLNLSKGDYENESLQLLRGSYLIVNTRDYLNTNTRLFGYGGVYNVSGIEKESGNYQISNPEKYNGSKSLFGVGGEFGLDLNFKFSSFKIGAGFTGGVTAEFGDYYTFRKAAARDGVIGSDLGLVFVTFSVFPILAYEISEKKVISGQINIGFPGFMTPSLTLNDDGTVYWISWFPDYDNRQNLFGHRLTIGFMMDINKINYGF